MPGYNRNAYNLEALTAALTFMVGGLPFAVTHGIASHDLVSLYLAEPAVALVFAAAAVITFGAVSLCNPPETMTARSALRFCSVAMLGILAAAVIWAGITGYALDFGSATGRGEMWHLPFYKGPYDPHTAQLMASVKGFAALYGVFFIMRALMTDFFRLEKFSALLLPLCYYAASLGTLAVWSAVPVPPFALAFIKIFLSMIAPYAAENYLRRFSSLEY